MIPIFFLPPQSRRIQVQREAQGGLNPAAILQPPAHRIGRRFRKGARPGSPTRGRLFHCVTNELLISVSIE